MKEFIVNLWKKYNHFTLFLLFIPGTYIFYLLQIHMEPKYIMHMKLDDYIPFVSSFIIPYVYWYVYCLWGYLYFAFYSKTEFTKFIAYLMLGAFTAYAVYYFFPNGQDLRNTIASDTLFNKIINDIRATDPPTNVFPSLHVYNSLAVNIAICTSTAFKSRKKRWVRILAYVSTILISMSTVMIKQHSIADVFGSMVMGTFYYFVVYVWVPNYLQKRKEKSIALDSESAIAIDEIDQ